MEDVASVVEVVLDVVVVVAEGFSVAGSGMWASAKDLKKQTLSKKLSVIIKENFRMDLRIFSDPKFRVGAAQSGLDSDD